MMFSLRALLACGLLMAAACDDNPGPDAGDADGDADADTDESPDADTDGDGDGDAPPDEPFAVTGVDPGHGIFSGFSQVVIRGRGFAEGARVFFGDTEVVAAGVLVQDENRISCITPPGEPNTFVDVRVVQGDLEATLPDGFYYDPCTLAPAQGSTSGGTYVVVSCLGTEFEAGVTVTFDGEEATGVDRVGPTELHLYSPPGRVGPADVVIGSVSGDVTLAEAFTYFENTDPTSGGLGGDPIGGNIEVTVFDAQSGAPLSDSFVIVGVDEGTAYQGRTDDGGHIVFSGPDLAGRQVEITVSHAPVPTPIDTNCDDEPDLELETFYETASFTEFDATYVSVLLVPVPPMVMVPPCGPPPEPVLSYIEGEIMFEHMGEFGPYEWEIVPEPASDSEFKLTFVQTTATDIFFDPPPTGDEIDRTGTVDPEDCGELSCSALIYDTEDYRGTNGYTYRIRSRFGVVAVYAIAGLFNLDTGVFTPWAFGIQRGVMVPAGEMVSNVDFNMITPLDETVFVTLDDPPVPVGWDTGPNRYITELFVDLGAEGVIWRPDRVVSRELPTEIHSYPSWMPRSGALADATLTVTADAYSFADVNGDGVEDLVYPFSVRYLRGVTNWAADVTVGDWIGVPHPSVPDYSGTVVDNHMEWTNGPGDFDFTNLFINRGGPYWDLILPASQTTVDLAPIPAESIPDVSDAQVDVWHYRVEPGFVFDRWAYSDMYRNAPEAFAANAWLVYF
jgi:hypothetical protein